MKKTCILITMFIFVFIILFTLYNNYLSPSKKPTDGVYYCEELKIEIDFSLHETSTKCAKLYCENNTYIILSCHFDYGNGIFLIDDSNQENIYYLSGSFVWKEDKIIVKSNIDNCSYVFSKVTSKS